MREYHFIMGISLIALALVFPAPWLLQMILIIGGAVNVGVAATWDARR